MNRSHPTPRGVMTSTTFKLIWLLLLSAVAACANVCTPLNYPANGPFPAIVNGLDAINWGVVRIQWTSDATTGTPATQQRVQYATAAQWAANPGVYPQTMGLLAGFVTDSTVIQGTVVTNLQPSTTYHIIGQSFQGGAWCSATDQTFTTLPYTTRLPKLPTQFSTTQPTVTGHDYTFGVDCGTNIFNSVTSNVQDCFNTAQPGDGIGFPPGTYQIAGVYVPHNPNAVKISGVSGSTIGSPAHGLSNGQQLHFGSLQAVPSPLNMGVTYKVINATADTFQVSYDGVNPITLLNGGSSDVFYVKWPLTQNYVYVHSTAPASSLPPPGVRLDPIAYASAMPNFQLTDPSIRILILTELTSYYWFQNIMFSTDPTVAPTHGNGADPVSFQAPWSTMAHNDHIVMNQCAMMPALPPSRSELIGFDGSNIGFLNSYIQGLDFWQPFRAIPYATTTSNSVTIPPGSYYWVGSGGPVGTKRSCTLPGSSTLTFSGSASGSFYVYIDPANCNLDVQIQSGLTASSTGSFHVSTVATPAYPTYLYMAPATGANYTLLNALTMGAGQVNSGSVTYTDAFGISLQDSEGGEALHSSQGPGPYMVVNNFIQGAGITGVFMSDDITDFATPCGLVNPCPVQYNQGNLTEQRNTITTHPCYFSGNPCWNGGNYSWRNLSETKQGKYVWHDANIYGPYYAQISQGECFQQIAYYANFPTWAGFPNYADSSELTFTNNTCYETPEGGGTGAFQTSAAITPAYPLNNNLFRNNLFLNDNAYAQVSPLQPLQAGVLQDSSQPGCPYGKLFQGGGYGQNTIWDHNTVFGQGGCQTWFYDQYATLASGMTFTNNIFNLVSDPGVWSNVTQTGTFSQANSTFGGSADVPDCAGFQGAALFGCMVKFTWVGNVVLATWTNSLPGHQVEFTSSQIASVKSLYPPNTFFPNAGNTLADRIAQIGWFSPNTGNFRLKNSSPYISGARASADGLDVGVDMDALESAQGKVSNVRTFGRTSTSTKVGFLAPDTFGCSVDWGTTDFTTGSGSFTRVANAGGQRVQNVTLTGLPADSLIYYRVNCAVQQPKGSIQLP